MRVACHKLGLVLSGVLVLHSQPLLNFLRRPLPKLTTGPSGVGAAAGAAAAGAGAKAGALAPPAPAPAPTPVPMYSGPYVFVYEFVYVFAYAYVRARSRVCKSGTKLLWIRVTDYEFSDLFHQISIVSKQDEPQRQRRRGFFWKVSTKKSNRCLSSSLYLASGSTCSEA